MKYESFKLGVLTQSSQRLNKLLLVLAGLTLLLVSACYWSVERVLEDERAKVDFHFGRLIENIHEHETYLRNVAVAYNRTNQNTVTSLHAHSRVEIMTRDDERVYQNRGLAMSMPFTLSERTRYNANDLQGAYSLGVQLTDYYNTFWSGSHYSAPQTFLFSPTDQFNIAIPGIDGTRKPAALQKSNFFEVTGRLYNALLPERERLNDNRVRWIRAPEGLLAPNKNIVAFIGIDITPSIMPARRDEGPLTLVSLLDPSQTNDMERLLAISIDNHYALISPTGDVLLGDVDEDRQVPLGFSLQRDGLRFRVQTSGDEPWIGLYTISYQGFFRYAQWPLLGAAGLFLLVALLGWRASVWYSTRVVQPAQRANDRLIESESFSRTMLHSAPIGLCVVQRNNGHVLMENDRAREWQGTGELVSLLKRDCANQEPGEVQIQVADRHLLASFISARYQGEDVVLWGFNDITRHVDDAQLMEQARRAADQASAAKTLFLATMSHEIRTPLYGVLGNLELLGLTELGPRQRDYLQTIQRSSSVLFQLISDVLDVSKIESGQMALETATFSPLDLLEDAARSYAAFASNKGLRVYACVDAALPALMSGDPGRILQILNNFLSNAIKFTDSGRVVIWLKVTEVDSTHASLQWQVSDTGSGISEKQLGQLFKPFSQLSGSERAGGAGLGLSICARLSEMMGANLRVVSEPGLGSSFSLHIRLPIVPGALPDCTDISISGLAVFVRAPLKEMEQSLIEWLGRWGAQAMALPEGFSGDEGAILVDLSPDAAGIWNGQRLFVGELFESQPRYTDKGWTINAFDIRSIARALTLACRGPGQTQPAVSQPPPRRLNLRILMAEDNPINRGILQEQLQALGVQVSATEDGEEALQRWTQDAFDAVITDINMPRMNGYELALALRERGARIPIIGVTANALREEGERCLASGMNAWMVKPLSLKSLRQALLDYCPQGLDAVAESPLLHSDLEGWITFSPQMRTLFIATMQDDIQQTRIGLKNANTAQVVQYLHRMNGAFASVCALRLADACKEWEDTLMTQSLDLASTDAIHALLNRLEAVLNALRLDPQTGTGPLNGT